MAARAPLRLWDRPRVVHFARSLPWAQLTRDTRALFSRVAPWAINRQLGQAELQVLLAHSKTETGFAQLWDGALAGSNNFGANQCTKGELGRGGGDTFICAPHLDHHGDGTPYTTGFQYFRAANGRSAAENGAAAYLRSVNAPIRANTGRALQRGASLREISATMRREHYFEANADKYAEALYFRAKEVARDLGQPLLVSLDGPATGSSSAAPLLFFLAAGAALAWAGGAFDD